MPTLLLRLSKLFFLIILLLATFIATGTLWTTRVSAADRPKTVIVDPDPNTPLPSKTSITLSTDSHSTFSSSVIYYVLAWPANGKTLDDFNQPKVMQGRIGPPTLGGKLVPDIKVDGSGTDSLTGQLDLSTPAGSQNANINSFPNTPWNIIICQPNQDAAQKAKNHDVGGLEDALKSCNNRDNWFSNPVTFRADFQPASKITPTPPPDLPQIELTENSQQCVYQSGLEDVNINVNKNLFPGRKYGWWWDGDWCKDNCHKDTNKEATESKLNFTIKKEDTAKLNGTKKFCVDIVNGASTRLGQRIEYDLARPLFWNCLTLVFVANIEAEKQRNPESIYCDPNTHAPVGSCAGEIGKKCAESGGVCQHGQCIKATTSAGIQCNPEGEKDAGQPEIGSGGISTAIGCIPNNFSLLVQQFVKVAIGAGGGVALLLIIAGAFQFITSAGNPDALKAATGRITSALIGLLFVIFSVLLLQVIGGNILDIPGIPGLGGP